MIVRDSSNRRSWRDVLRARRMGRLLACAEVRERLEFFLSPVLARREERRGIAHHLAVCPVCPVWPVSPSRIQHRISIS